MAEKKETRTIGVLTSGGDAPGMNCAIRAVTRRAIDHGIKVKGIMKGYEGLFSGEIIDLHAKDVSGILAKGGTILYTARCKEMMDAEGVQMAASMLARREIDALVVIGGDGSFRGALELSRCGINVIGIPATIDLDVACSDYTIGFDTAVNTAMTAIDKVRDSSASHEKVSIIEVMGRHAGLIALWCGIANGAEDILLPEKYDGDEQKVIDNIIDNRRRGKTHHIIVNAEGVGDTLGMAKRIEEATGIGTRTTILGFMQRGGSPTAKDRVYASTMGCHAVDLIAAGKKNRIVVHSGGRFGDIDIEKALMKERVLPEYEYEIAQSLSHNYYKSEAESLLDLVD